MKEDHRSYITQLKQLRKESLKKKFRQHVVLEKKEKPEKIGRALH